MMYKNISYIRELRVSNIIKNINYHHAVDRIAIFDFSQQTLLPMEHTNGILYVLIDFRMFVFQKTSKRYFQIAVHCGGGQCRSTRIVETVTFDAYHTREARRVGYRFGNRIPRGDNGNSPISFNSKQMFHNTVYRA